MNPINATSTTTVQPASSPPVKPNSGAPAGDVATNASNAATTGSASGAGNAPTSSTVTTISTISTQLQAAQATSSSDAVFSSNKVSEIKLAISEGRFQVNSEKVANGLLESVSELLNSRR